MFPLNTHSSMLDITLPGIRTLNKR